MKILHGFTLIELIVVIAVFGVLAALATPAYQNMMTDNRRTSDINKLAGTLNLARSEAIKRNRTISVCASDAAATAVNCSGTNWQTGWLVFEDMNANGDFDSGSDNAIRIYDRIYRRSNPTYDVTLRAVDGGANLPFISYLPRGYSNTDASFIRCDDRGQTAARGVIISNTGRARLSQDTDSDDIHEDHTGSDMTC